MLLVCSFQPKVYFKFMQLQVKVEYINWRAFEQEVMYEWILEYCPKSMQVRTSTKEGPLYKVALKLLNKWVQKQDTTNGAVGPR